MCVFVRLVGSLKNNNIGDAGAVGLLEGIKGHPTLRTLNVHDNPMSEESKAALLEAIEVRLRLLRKKYKDAMAKNPNVLEAVLNR